MYRNGCPVHVALVEERATSALGNVHQHLGLQREASWAWFGFQALRVAVHQGACVTLGTKGQ